MPKAVKEQPSTIYIGIDPGTSGGISVMYSFNARANASIPMPATELDVWNFLEPLTRIPDTKIVAVIEKVWASPQAGRKQGGSSMFTFGQGFGACRMALTAIGAEWEEITPQKWMKSLGIPSTPGAEKKDQKEKLRAFAQRLYPKLPIWGEPRSLTRQRAICDALLIATFCKRKYEGTL